MLIGTRWCPRGIVHTDTLVWRARKGKKAAVIIKWETHRIARFDRRRRREYGGPWRAWWLCWVLERTTAIKRRTEVAPIELFIESLRRIAWARFLVDRLEMGE
jgi:hypothetical protein